MSEQIWTFERIAEWLVSRLGNEFKWPCQEILDEALALGINRNSYLYTTEMMKRSHGSS